MYYVYTEVSQSFQFCEGLIIIINFIWDTIWGIDFQRFFKDSLITCISELIYVEDRNWEILPPKQENISLSNQYKNHHTLNSNVLQLLLLQLLYGISSFSFRVFIPMIVSGFYPSRLLHVPIPIFFDFSYPIIPDIQMFLAGFSPFKSAHFS